MPMPYEQMPPSDREMTDFPPQERLLAPDEQIQIDLDTPIADTREVQRVLGLSGELVAIIGASSQDFFVVDTRDSRSNRDFLIIDETFSMKDRTGFKGVSKDNPVTIGRSHHADRFTYAATVSRDHFEVSYTDNGLSVRNLRPTNGTSVLANSALEHQLYHVDDGRTELGGHRMHANPNFVQKDETAPYGYYMNLPIIGRASTSVDGGVYLGGSAREAIVVDGKSAPLQQAYQEVVEKIRQSFGGYETLPLRATLLKVMRGVQEIMPYDSDRTHAISQKHYGDKLVGLSTYVEAHAGVCRHQGLLAAYIIGSLIDEGHMPGIVGMERNTVVDMGGTHAWAVYKTSKDVIVVDPAQSFVGTKAQALREDRWEYRLTTDDY